MRHATRFFSRRHVGDLFAVRGDHGAVTADDESGG
jgi:hypothetical protein